MYNQFQYPQQGYQSMQYQQHQQQAMNWIPVNGLQGVKDYIVQPNEKAWFMDNNDQIFYVKIGDALGKSTIEAYMFEKMSLDDIEPKYITVAEFEEFKKSLRKDRKEA